MEGNVRTDAARERQTPQPPVAENAVAGGVTVPMRPASQLPASRRVLRLCLRAGGVA